MDVLFLFFLFFLLQFKTSWHFVLDLFSSYSKCIYCLLGLHFTSVTVDPQLLISPAYYHLHPFNYNSVAATQPPITPFILLNPSTRSCNLTFFYLILHRTLSLYPSTLVSYPVDYFLTILTFPDYSTSLLCCCIIAS